MLPGSYARNAMDQDEHDHWPAICPHVSQRKITLPHEMRTCASNCFPVCVALPFVDDRAEQ